MFLYRSDWSEIGLDTPFAEPIDISNGSAIQQALVLEKSEGSVRLWLLAVPNRFETGLYGFPFYEIRMEASSEGPDPRLLTSQDWVTFARDNVHEMLQHGPFAKAYLFAKVVPGEPLHGALLTAGFEPVEERRVFKTTVSELAKRKRFPTDTEIEYLTLEQVPVAERDNHRRQILDVASEAFQEGESRHFRDPVLTNLVTGVDYILCLMEMNFASLSPNAFLLARERDTRELVGFSVVGKKDVLSKEAYTQLLSGVRVAWPGRGIYRVLTRLLRSTLPTSAPLLNVTHSGNVAMQWAYRQSGRRHLADTILLRIMQ